MNCSAIIKIRLLFEDYLNYKKTWIKFSLANIFKIVVSFTPLALFGGEWYISLFSYSLIFLPHLEHHGL